MFTAFLRNPNLSLLLNHRSIYLMDLVSLEAYGTDGFYFLQLFHVKSTFQVYQGSIICRLFKTSADPCDIPFNRSSITFLESIFLSTLIFQACHPKKSLLFRGK
jgi:hypothetical protein